VPWARAADLSAASGGLTTLDQTIVKGSKLADGTLGSYYRLTFGAGEPHLPRTDLHPASYAPIHCAMSFVHFTDSHLVDAQSPGRVEFLDRYSEQQCGTLPFDAAFRPHEALALQVQEAMIRAIRRIRVGPATGKPFKFVIATGDNTDNEQFKDQTFGNHDGLMQGNAPRNAALAAVATGPLKFDGPPPGLNLCVRSPASAPRPCPPISSRRTPTAATSGGTSTSNSSSTPRARRSATDSRRPTGPVRRRSSTTSRTRRCSGSSVSIP